MPPTQPPAPQDTERLVKLCPCHQCPSWVECGEKGAYCLDAMAKSACIKEGKGCICGGCPVEQEMGFKHGYYCIKGNESTQKEDKK